MGQEDLVGRLVTPINHIVTLLIPIINLLTGFPHMEALGPLRRYRGTKRVLPKIGGPLRVYKGIYRGI